MIQTPQLPAVAPAPEPLYLTGGPEPVFATFHAPEPVRARANAVLICPPFGWDEVCAYRCLRAWAVALADAGYPTLRVSYPSTGDSGGSARDPGRLEAWVASITEATGWLRRQSAARRVTAIGLGLGGLLAHLAAAGGAELDDFVMWGSPGRGRAFVRQLTAFSKVEAGQIFGGRPDPEPLPEDELEAGGFLLSSETLAALRAVTLTEHPLPARDRRRALLLSRDGLAVDATLRQALEASGAQVSEAPGPGFAAMTSHPQEARPATETWATVRAWLDATSEPAPAPGPPAELAPGAARSSTLGRGSDRVRETPITVPYPRLSLTGVLVEPVAPVRPGPAVVLLNAGAVRRIGPNRMWVEAARRWAANGVRVLRLDVAGIGDSDGDSRPYRLDAGLYVPELVPQVLGALDLLEGRGWGRRYVLGGLCAGAYWSFHALLEDDRVQAGLLLNPRALVWDADLGLARELRDLSSRPFTRARARRALRSPERLRHFARAIRWWLLTPSHWGTRHQLAHGQLDRIDAALARFAAAGKPTLFIFSDNEPLEQELAESGRLSALESLPHVRLERIPVRDHTLRPNWSQRRAHALLDAALATVLSGPERCASGPR